MARETLEIYQVLINRNAVPNEHRETVDELVRRGVLKGGASAKPDVGWLEGTARQALDAFTFGYNDKAAAAIKSTLYGDTYENALQRERARTQASNSGLPWLVGQTAGNTAQAVMTMPAAPAVGTYQAARELMRPAAGLGQQIVEAMPNALRYGTAFGAANAAGHSDGSVGRQLTDIAEGAATGAALAPVVTAGFMTAGAGLARAQRGQETRRDAAAGRLADMREAGVTDPLPAAVSGSGIPGVVTRMSGAGIGGGPVNAKAAENINQLTTNINRTLARPIEGQEAGDLGRSIQSDLRRALITNSRSSDELAAMAPDDLQRMTGPISSEGFNPPRPQVAPIQPRQVEDILPRDVGPPPQKRETMPARNLEDIVAARERDIAAAVAEHNAIEDAARAAQRTYEPTFRIHSDLTKQQQALRDQADRMSAPGAYIKLRNDGETPASYYQRLDEVNARLAAVDQRLQQIAPDVAVATEAVQRYGNFQARIDRIRQLHSDRDTAARNLADARGREAAENVQFERATADYSAAQKRAAAEAAEETARRREQARLDAEASTVAAREAAERQYQERIAAGDSGFRVGRSQESYPTELSAGYEMASRSTPPMRFNPLGDVYTNTATTRLLEDVGKTAKQSMQIRDYSGRVFADDGALDPALAGYLRNRIGNDLVGRLEALAELRNRGGIAQPGVDGMKKLLSDIRTAARAAERPPYPGVPRTEDAALLRRLATAVKDDLYAVMSRQGQPASFRTTQGEYTVTPRGNTQAGSQAPAEATYYVTPENFERFTRGGSREGQTASWPATLSLRADKNQIGRFDNQKGAFDRSSMVPFETQPQPGLIPIQVWGDGTRVRYGGRITDRDTTTGERAVNMWRNVDDEYSRYVNEMRRPLAAVFGENVQGVQALDRLVRAARQGETGVIGPFMRVMREKSDPNRGAAAIVYHMTNGGRNLDDFISGYRSLHPTSRRLMFDTGPEGRALEQSLNRYVAVGERLLPFTNAARQQSPINPSRVTHLVTVAGVWASMPMVVGAVAGNAMASRVLASPRMLRWMTEFPQAARGGFDTNRFKFHIAHLSAMAAKGKERSEAKALLGAVNQAISKPDKDQRQ